MNLAPRKRYTPEFKAQAVELLCPGKPVSQVAEGLCISTNLPYSWRHSAQGAQLGGAGAQTAGARAPQPGSCAPCAAKTLSCARRMTF